MSNQPKDTCGYREAAWQSTEERIRQLEVEVNTLKLRTMSPWVFVGMIIVGVFIGRALFTILVG